MRETSPMLNVDAATRDGVMAFIGYGKTRLERPDGTQAWYARETENASAEWVQAYVEWV